MRVRHLHRHLHCHLQCAAAALVVGFVLLSTRARASEPTAAAPSGPAASGYPVEYTKRPQVVTSRMLQLRLDTRISLSDRAYFDPVIVSPQIDFGLSDDWQVSLRHERSLCLNGLDSAQKCDFYAGPGLELKGHLVKVDTFSLAAFAGPYLNAFDPLLLQARLGLGLWALPVDNFAINAQAYVGIGVTNRTQGSGLEERVVNADVLGVALQPSFNIIKPLAIYFDTGLYGTFQDFSNKWAIPFGFGAVYTLLGKLDVGGDFSFFQIMAANDSGGPRFRQLNLQVRYRFDFSK
jgi:hypothetical protein